MSTKHFLPFFLFLIITVSSLSLHAQPKGKRIQGDLYFHFFDFQAFHQLGDSILTAWENEIMQLPADSLDEFGKAIKDAMVSGLIRRPYVAILIGSKEYKLFISWPDTALFSGITLSRLEDEHKCVRITAKAKKVRYLGQKAYAAIGPIRIEEVEGITHNNKYE